jgi:hypothetical protein
LSIFKKKNIKKIIIQRSFGSGSLIVPKLKVVWVVMMKEPENIRLFRIGSLIFYFDFLRTPIKGSNPVV